MGQFFSSIWLVAGMAESDPSVVGSIASFCKLPESDYLYHRYGWIFGELSYSCHGFLSSYS